jgi:hypothetical protein
MLYSQKCKKGKIMDNLEQIEKLEKDIDEIFNSLITRTMVNIVRKLRKYQVQGYVEIHFESIAPKNEKHYILSGYNNYFDEQIKALVFFEKEDLTINFKKELKDICFFAFRFQHYRINLHYKYTGNYSEQEMLEHLMWNMNRKANFDIKQATDNVYQEIERLNIMDEKKHLEAQVAEKELTTQLKL